MEGEGYKDLEGEEDPRRARAKGCRGLGSKDMQGKDLKIDNTDARQHGGLGFVGTENVAEGVECRIEGGRGRGGVEDPAREHGSARVKRTLQEYTKTNLFIRSYAELLCEAESGEACLGLL